VTFSALPGPSFWFWAELDPAETDWDLEPPSRRGLGAVASLLQPLVDVAHEKATIQAAA